MGVILATFPLTYTAFDNSIAAGKLYLIYIILYFYIFIYILYYISHQYIHRGKLFIKCFLPRTSADHVQREAGRDSDSAEEVPGVRVPLPASASLEAADQGRADKVDMVKPSYYTKRYRRRNHV